MKNNFKSLTILTTLIILTSLTTAFSGNGTGTTDKPYQITNCSQLQEMEDDLDAHYELTENVDCEDFTYNSVGEDSNGNRFTGSLDGQGYEVQNLEINEGSSVDVGLIGILGSGGEVKDIGVVDMEISGNEFVGGLVGFNHRGGSNNENGGSVSNSYTTGNVSGGSGVGGLVGYNGGYSAPDASVSSSYSTVSVSGGSGVGGLVGYNYGGVSDSYWDTESSGQSSSAGGTGLTTSEMQGSSAETNMNGFDFPDTWLTVSNDYPKLNPFEGGDGSSSNPYQISTCQQLQNMQNDLDANYELINNVDCSSYSGFRSVGEYGNEFTGSLNGQGYEVQNLEINEDLSSATGLIGQLDNGEIKNIGVIDSEIAGSGGSGILVGFNNGSVSNSYASGRVTGNDYVGGLVGRNTGNVSDSYSTGNVTSNGFFDVGGLVGRNTGNVSDSYWDTESSSQDSSDGGTGLTTSEMQGATPYCDGTMTGLDFENTWFTQENDYPGLRSFESEASNIDCNSPPTADFSFSPNDPVIEENIVFDAASSSDVDGSILSFSWDFNGSVDTGETAIYTFSEPGNKNVELNVTDDDGATNTVVKTVTVGDVVVLDLDWSGYSSVVDPTGFNVYYGVNEIDENNVKEVGGSEDGTQIFSEDWVSEDDVCVEVRPFNSAGEAEGAEDCVTIE